MLVDTGCVTVYCIVLTCIPEFQPWPFAANSKFKFWIASTKTVLRYNAADGSVLYGHWQSGFNVRIASIGCRGRYIPRFVVALSSI